MEGYTALANSSVTEVEFLYQQQLARSAAETKKIGDSSKESGKMLPETQRKTKGLIKGK
jgi:hypothetical protein